MRATEAVPRTNVLYPLLNGALVCPCPGLCAPVTVRPYGTQNGSAYQIPCHSSRHLSAIIQRLMFQHQAVISHLPTPGEMEHRGCLFRRQSSTPCGFRPNMTTWFERATVLTLDLASLQKAPCSWRCASAPSICRKRLWMSCFQSQSSPPSHEKTRPATNLLLCVAMCHRAVQDLVRMALGETDADSPRWLD